MEVMKKPVIKSIPYEEFQDNETLEKIIQELNAGGVNVVVGALDQLIDWGRSNSPVAAHLRHQLLWHRVHGRVRRPL